MKAITKFLAGGVAIAALAVAAPASAQFFPGMGFPGFGYGNSGYGGYGYNNVPGDYAIATASAGVHVSVKGMHFQTAPALAGMDFSPTIPTTEINSFCAPQPCQ